MKAEGLIPYLHEAEACFRSGDYEEARAYADRMPDIHRIQPAVDTRRVGRGRPIFAWSRVNQAVLRRVVVNA